MPAADVTTAPRLAYLRLHGRDASAYLTGRTVAERFHYDYSDAELDEVMDRADALAENFVHFWVTARRTRPSGSRGYPPADPEKRRPGPPGKTFGMLVGPGRPVGHGAAEFSSLFSRALPCLPPLLSRLLILSLLPRPFLPGCLFG
jgi:hypothetical protein